MVIYTEVSQMENIHVWRAPRFLNKSKSSCEVWQCNALKERNCQQSIAWDLSISSPCFLGRRSYIPDMYARVSTMPIPPHIVNLPCLSCDFSRINMGLFGVHFPLHSRTHRWLHTRLNRDSLVKNTWLQSCCVQSRCSAAQLLRTAWCFDINGMHTIGLRV